MNCEIHILYYSASLFLFLVLIIALDIALLVDSSSDITNEKWDKIISFLKDVIKKINRVSPDPNSNRFGLIGYSSRPQLYLRFHSLYGKNPSLDETVRRLDDITRTSGPRRIDLALEMTGREIFSDKGGQRPHSRKVPFTFNSLI